MTTIRAVELEEVVSSSYQLLGELGRGGYGTVFKALQRSTGQLVTIKFQRLGDFDDDERAAVRTARFERETKLGAALSHPHIVRMLDKGRAGPYLFMVLEFVAGETLARMLARRRVLPVPEAVALMSQVLDALDAAHSQGVIHRDLKPDNIMVLKDTTAPHVKVLDFGAGAFVSSAPHELPSLTRSQELVGTPSYCAPEQLRGEPASAKSDIYAWGLVLLESITGRRVMNGATLAEVFHKQLSRQEVQLPAAIAAHPLGDLLRRAVAKSPRERAGSAGQLWTELRRIPSISLLGFLSHAASASADSAAFEPAVLRREMRQVTLCCVSLSAAIARGADGSDIEIVDTIEHDQLSTCGDIVTRYGGTVLGNLANRLIAAFGLPHATDSDARRAARAALEISSKIESRRELLRARRGIDLELRIALHTDVVIVNEDSTLSGPALNLASRLEGMTRVGATWVTKATRDLLYKHFHLRAVDATDHDQQEPLFELSSEAAGEAAARDPVFGGASRLVGRNAELMALTQRWSAALERRGSVVLLRGEPGIGKSRLVRELHQRVLASGGDVFDCGCLPENAQTALQPLAEPFRQYFELGEGVQALALRASLDEWGLPSAELIPIFKAWLAIEEGGDGVLAHVSRDRQRELLIDALAKVLCGASREAGALIIFEDVHWADPTTRNLIARIGERAATLPVLCVLTARPELPAPPFAELIELSSLPEAAIEELIDCTSGTRPFSSAALKSLVARSQGIPLFAEELARHFAGGGRVASSPVGAPYDPLPRSLRDVLGSRLDRLGPAKETAQLAAAIGREFDLCLLVEASSRSAESVQADVQALVEADLIVQQLRATGAHYLFRHALIAEAAWESMLPSQRRSAHRALAEALGEPAAHGGADLARLARHCELGGLAERAARYRLAAGQNAAQVSAYAEALENFRCALAVLGEVEDSRARFGLEIDIQNAIGGVLIATQGLATPEVVNAFSRALHLIDVGDPTEDQRFTTLKGAWTFHNARAEYARAAELTEQLLALADVGSSAELHLAAHDCACQTAMLTGDFHAATRHAASCEQWFDPGIQRASMAKYGTDPWLVTVSFECISNVQLGRLTRARARLQMILEEVERLGDPSMKAAMLAQAAGVMLFIGIPGWKTNQFVERAESYAREAIEIARSGGFAFWEAQGSACSSMADAVLGKTGGVEGLRKAIGMWSMSGAKAALGWQLAYLASGERVLGRHASALTAAERAVEHCVSTGEGYGASEAYRALGDVLCDPLNPGAEPARGLDALREAYAIAERQGAHWLSLTAAYTLALRAPSSAQARRLLADSLRWFQTENEGLDTPLVKACSEALERGSPGEPSAAKAEVALGADRLARRAD